MLTKHHSIFSLEGERGDTSLVELAIDTGNAVPKKQAARKIPHAAREEINSHAVGKDANQRGDTTF